MTTVICKKKQTTSIRHLVDETIPVFSQNYSYNNYSSFWKNNHFLFI